MSPLCSLTDRARPSLYFFAGEEGGNPPTLGLYFICISCFPVSLMLLFTRERSVFTSTPPSPLACLPAAFVHHCPCSPCSPREALTLPTRSAPCSVPAPFPLHPLLALHSTFTLILCLLYDLSSQAATLPFGFVSDERSVQFIQGLSGCPHALLQTSRFPVSGPG